MTGSLADATTPLVLADGTRINPLDGSTIRDPRTERSAPKGFVEVPSASDAIKQVTRVRKSLDDLPAPPKQMNAISVIVMYTMIGLSDIDISLATGMTVEQIGRIKMLEAYSTVHDDVVKAVLENDTDDVRTTIAQNAKKALNVMVNSLDAESDILAFQAAKDILDRAGHRPVDVVDHRLTLAGGLRIEHVRRSDDSGINLDLSPGDA